MLPHSRMGIRMRGCRREGNFAGQGGSPASKKGKGASSISTVAILNLLREWDSHL
jgi:hypothetical protein